MSDKQLGYILMFPLLFLTVGFTAYFFWIVYHPMETRTLRFTEVGALAVEDPVRMEGVWVGEVYDFEIDDSGYVLVHVRSPKPLPVRTSSRAAVKVKGVMGERFIEISIGDRDDPLIDKDQIIDGVFEMGPSEAVVYMDLLSDKIIELKDIMQWLRDGRGDGKRPFIAAFSDLLETVDTLVYGVLTGLSEMEEGLNDGVDIAADIAVKTIKLTSDVSAKAPELIESVSGLIVKMDELIPKIEKIFAQIETFAGKVDENKLLWGDHLERLNETMAEIRIFIQELREHGLPLSTKLRFF